MKITKNIISEEEAKKLSPDYVQFITGKDDTWDKIIPYFDKLKKGQSVITFIDGVFVRAKVSSINHNDFRAVDGPLVRVSNGEYSWRVDGDKYAFPINA
jgi:hypothetical protein